jgi:peptidoglycan-N-acetylglucosamine deacetylase
VAVLLVETLGASGSKKLGAGTIDAGLRRALAHDQEVQNAARQQRAIDGLLESTPVIREGSGDVREVALTFDDGPGPYTPAILDTLIRHHVPATFFPVGFMINDFPDSIRREVANGFAIGDHTENHRKLTELSPEDQEAELLGQADALARQGAPFPRLFRPPYGAYDASTLDMLRRHRMLMILWTVETGDYERPGDAAIVQHVLDGVHPGAIVLLHDGGGDRSETVAALPKVIKALRARGYRLVTVPQLLLDGPPTAETTLSPGLLGD